MEFEMTEYTRPAGIGNGHDCGIDCERITPDGRHILYPAAPTIDAGRYQFDRNVGMTRAEYRASGQDETRECRVWAAERAQGWYRGIRWDYRAAEAERVEALYYSGRERSADEGRGL
jgi:hypothetical protein